MDNRTEDKGKKDIVSLSYEELIFEMKEIGEKPFRGKQIYGWMLPMKSERFRWLRGRFPKRMRQKNFCLSFATDV